MNMKVRNGKILIEYSTNNSGGNWWLTKQNWKDLEKEGWKLFNCDEFIYKNGDHAFGRDGLPKRVSPRVKDETFEQYAHYGFKYFDSIEEAVREFEEITGQDVEEEGCECCGQPHSISKV